MSLSPREPPPRIKHWLNMDSLNRLMGAAALALGGIYSMFMAKPEKVADVGYKTDPDAVAKHRAQR